MESPMRHVFHVYEFQNSVLKLISIFYLLLIIDRITINSLLTMI